MARTPDGQEARTITVPVRFTPTGAAHLDAARGHLTRSQYLRKLVAQDVHDRRIRPKD